MSGKQELHPRTVIINKSQKNQSRKARDEALIWLATTFPQAFDNTLKIRPLKIGIMEDILTYAEEAEKQEISKSKLREAVVLFTRRLDYLTCLKAKEMRIDLQGNPVAMVTEEEAEKASNKIKKRIEKSLRNAKKTIVKQEKTGYCSSKPTFDFNPYYTERQPMYNTQPSVQTAKSSVVLVKHKTARQYDPEVVARLKQKLGLRIKDKKEVTE
jgi:ProP effector